MLAHKASHEGILVAEAQRRTQGPTLQVSETRSDVTGWVIPQAIFTDPEIASVGLSEKKAKEEGYDIIVGRFPYAALGKAQGMRETEGFFQVIADVKSERLLGAQIIGAEASALIAEAALAVQNKLALSAIADGIHAHPTLPEGLKEAAAAALGRAIHAVNR
jgi:dihydrolipoamide dehydrogenase